MATVVLSAGHRGGEVVEWPDADHVVGNVQQIGKLLYRLHEVGQPERSATEDEPFQPARTGLAVYIGRADTDA